MKLYYQLVSVQDIQSSLFASQFPTDEIEKAAHLFLEAELSIQPVVLQQKGLESYSVIYGDFIYFAAVRAREINPRKAETIQAVVLDPEHKSALVEQVELFKKESRSPTKSNDLAGRLNNFEQTIAQKFNDLVQTVTEENKVLKSSLKSVEERIPKRDNLLDSFNSSSEKELRQLIRKAGVREGNIDKIVPQILTNQPFTSLQEIPKKIRGFSERAMLKLIESWLNTLEIT